jgi:ParB-like chromosome segregation protein Spo0J
MSVDSALALATVPTDSLVFDPANARYIDEPTIDALGRSIHEFGFVQPVIARRADRVGSRPGACVADPRSPLVAG